jgi:hypothetical protein
MRTGSPPRVSRTSWTISTWNLAGRRRAPRSPRDARDVAVMVGTPDVDQLVVAALQLLAMVADVGGEVGQLAVAALHDAVLVVAERRGAEPGGPVAS